MIIYQSVPVPSSFLLAASFWNNHIAKLHHRHLYSDWNTFTFTFKIVFDATSNTFNTMLKLRVDLPHVRQKFDWDCGLSCLQMVLKKYFGDKFQLEEFEAVCEKKNFGKSVWTIDLATILTEFGLDYILYTITLGVDESYETNKFYQQFYDADQYRVNNLFNQAEELGICVEKRSITIEDIITKIKEGFVAIVLVNSSILYCEWCEMFPPVAALLLSYCAGCASGSNDFCGHFIVLCGFDQERKCVYYMNPSKREGVCCAKFRVFERARNSYGTDEDIIFIDFNQQAKDSTVRLNESS